MELSKLHAETAAGVEASAGRDEESPGQWRVLVCTSDAGLRRSLLHELQDPRLRCLEADGSAAALELLDRQAIDVVVADDPARGQDGVEFLEQVRGRWPATRRVLVTGSDHPEHICDAVNRGGVSYVLPRPLQRDKVAQVIDDLTRTPRPAASTDTRPGSRFGIVGQSPAIRELIQLIERVAATDSTVLATGETGTGKELVGSAIHQASRRRDGVFCAINSAAMPETLLESELFGHRRGAFTGATSDKKGLFEQAHGGTVFLDELGEMPLSMQAKLLRFLQTGEVRAVGSSRTRRVDVRLVGATNRDLEEEVAAGRFREDLYYRLAVIPIHVPPLRERIMDVPLLVEHFLAQMAARSGRRVVGVEPDAMEVLLRHAWPGNVRELQNAIERGVALCSGDRIGVRDLPARLLAPPPKTGPEGVQSLPGLERQHILETLEKVGWNRKRAAGLLEISTTTLWRRLKEFGIDASREAAAKRGVSMGG